MTKSGLAPQVFRLIPKPVLLIMAIHCVAWWDASLHHTPLFPGCFINLRTLDQSAVFKPVSPHSPRYAQSLPGQGTLPFPPQTHKYIQFQKLFKILIFPQNSVHCLNKRLSVDKLIRVISRKTENMECWMQKDPRDQPALQLRHTDVDTRSRNESYCPKSHRWSAAAAFTPGPLSPLI